MCTVGSSVVAAALVLLVTSSFSSSASAGPAAAVPLREQYLARAQRVLADHPVIDGHNDLPWQLRGQLENHLYEVDLREVQTRFHTDIPRLRAGGVGGNFWSVYVTCDVNYLNWNPSVRETLEQIDVTQRMIEHYSDDLQLALTAADIRSALASGKIASLMGMEGGNSIDSSLGTLRTMYHLGARYMTLTHNCHTPWADTCREAPVNNGLTDFGVAVVAEMNRLGMLVDISHVSFDTMHDVLAVTKAPVIFSHSASYTLCNHSRNVPDDVLVKTGDNGGVVMVNFVPDFVCGNSLTVVADHILYIANLIGWEHVGIGADYDGATIVADLPDVSTYPLLVAELIARGATDDQLALLLNENILRVLEENERVAADLQQTTQPGEEWLPSYTRTCPALIAV